MTSELYAPRNYAGELSDAFSGMAGKVPTFERSLDRYFDEHFPEIIDEWGLLTDRDLQALDARLSTLSAEIDRLFGAKPLLETRVADLEREIAALEAGHGR